MNCGRSDTWDKIGCAAEIIASEGLEFLECMTGVDAGCVRAIAGEAIDCVGGECIFEIGEECLSFERDFEFNMEMLENYENIDVTLSGNMNLHVGMDLTLDLKEWEFTLTATSTISHSLEVDVVSSAEHVYQEEKALTRPYQLFRKVRRLGFSSVPSVLSACQIYAWNTFLFLNPSYRNSHHDPLWTLLSAFCCKQLGLLCLRCPGVGRG